MRAAEELKEFARDQGASLVGVADLAALKEGLRVVPPDILQPYGRAVSIAVALEPGIIEALGERPTPEYAAHYREANKRLDALAEDVAQWIAEEGYRALPVAASHIVDDVELRGSVSHKAVARMAGIGWQGKSLLIVSPEYGPALRLATVLTDMPLPADKPLANGCGGCFECAEACPAMAIKGEPTGDYYKSREEAVDISKCNLRLMENLALPGIGARVCGICIKVCPHRRG